MLNSIALLLLTIFFNFTSTSPIATIIFPTEGQYIPLGTESTYVTVVWTASGFTPSSGNVIVKKEGYPVAYGVASPFEGTQGTFVSTVSFGINITGPIEIITTAQTANQSILVSATRNAVINPTYGNCRNAPIFVPCNSSKKCDTRTKIF